MNAASGRTSGECPTGRKDHAVHTAGLGYQSRVRTSRCFRHQDKAFLMERVGGGMESFLKFPCLFALSHPSRFHTVLPFLRAETDSKALSITELLTSTNMCPIHQAICQLWWAYSVTQTKGKIGLIFSDLGNHLSAQNVEPGLARGGGGTESIDNGNDPSSHTPAKYLIGLCKYIVTWISVCKNNSFNVVIISLGQWGPGGARNLPHALK